MVAGLVSGIVWNLLTWLLGIPSSSSHALIVGIVRATLAAVGGHGVIWTHLVTDVTTHERSPRRSIAPRDLTANPGSWTGLAWSRLVRPEDP